ncbi:membrane-associated transporter protein-like [Babylonia areolata]|uniref:membrane-associated transporter protein-like n=1 Tax=Babylonia areolata TaxID=304850 RepID=UPI003FD2519C
MAPSAGDGDTTTTTTTTTSRKDMAPPPFSLGRRVQLCIVTLALESYISFEEIFMLPVLQRVDVPVVLVSLPGTISSAIGVFIIPLLGWASDRSTCCSKHCGRKRPFAALTLAVAVVGVAILVFVSLASLYDDVGSSAVPSFLGSGNITTAAPPVVGDLANATVYDGSSVRYDGGGVPGEGAGGQGELFDPAMTAALPAVRSTAGPPLFSAEGLFGNATIAQAREGGRLKVRDTVTQDTSSGGDLQFLSTRRERSAELPPSSSPQQPSSPTPASPPVNGSEAKTTASASSSFLTLMGILGIIGFVLSDHGYDSSMSTFKAYMIAVTPASQHDDIFILGTLVGAVGGCLTSLLGFVDLAALYPDTGAVLDKGMAQCLTQAVILMTKLIVLGSITMLTGSESPEHSHHHDLEVPPAEKETIIDECDNITVKDGADTTWPTHPVVANGFRYTENTPLVAPSGGGSRVADVLKRWKPRILLCVMTFLGLSANYSYFVYVSNYVAEVIFQGDPNADTDSQAYDDYVQGVHIASLGMLTFYILFVVYNVFHQKILSKIGMRAEYMAASVACAALTATLAATDNIVVFFVNSVTMAIFRAAVYTVPFILSNNLAKEEAKNGKATSASSAGVAMATITAMIPASYFVVSLVMGPLMDVTGYPGMPVIFSSACCVLGVLSTLCVRFE